MTIIILRINSYLYVEIILHLTSIVSLTSSHHILSNASRLQSPLQLLRSSVCPHLELSIVGKNILFLRYSGIKSFGIIPIYLSPPAVCFTFIPPDFNTTFTRLL